MQASVPCWKQLSKLFDHRGQSGNADYEDRLDLQLLWNNLISTHNPLHLDAKRHCSRSFQRNQWHGRVLSYRLRRFGSEEHSIAVGNLHCFGEAYPSFV